MISQNIFMTVDPMAMMSLVIATALLGLSPGPAVFATIARAINLGLGRTYIFIAGIVAGDFLFALLAMLGLAALVSQFNTAFFALKMIGGLYLIYLGYKAWQTAGKARKEDIVQQENGWKLFLSGFLLTSSNPKDLLFFVSFLPAFVNLNTPSLKSLIIPALLIVVTFIVTLSVYALGAYKIRTWLNNKKSVFWLNRIAAITMTAVGLAILFS